MSDALILSAVRTPIGKYLGAFTDAPAVQLGAAAIAEALRRANAPAGQVDEVVVGNVLQAGLGQNPARQAALEAGLPDTIAAYTVNKVCGSGLKAVMLAAQSIRAAFSFMSPPAGQATTEQPLRSARSTVPWPPWQTTTSQRAIVRE